MKRLCVFIALILTATGLGCSSKEVTIEQEANSERQLSPEEQRVQENLKRMMENPMAPPPGMKPQEKAE
jgi:hypothetical protein